MSPKVPKAPPPPKVAAPIPEMAGIDRAAQARLKAEEEQRAKQRRGRAATILTQGSRGDDKKLGRVSMLGT